MLLAVGDTEYAVVEIGRLVHPRVDPHFELCVLHVHDRFLLFWSAVQRFGLSSACDQWRFSRVLG